MSNRYPIQTLADIAAIPEDVLPRFLAELPAILESLRQMDAAAETLADEARDKAPWLLRWMVTGDVVRASIKKAAGVWIDDGKGTATVRMTVAKGSPDFFSRTEKMTGGEA